MSYTVDTSVVPLGERFDYWSSSAPAAMHPMALDRADHQRFSGMMRVHRIGAVEVFHITCDALTVHRTTRLIRAYDPAQLNLVDVLRGSCRVRQGGRDAVIRPGDLCGHGTSTPYTYWGDTPFELLLYGIPRSLLGPSADQVFAATATTVNAAGGEVARLAQDFLRNLAFGLEAGRVDATSPGLADCVAGLTRSLYSHTPADPLGDHPGGLYPQLLAYIDAHLADPDLGPIGIARAHFISLRRLQKVFQQHDTTVTGHIRAARLERCRHDLASPADRDRTVTQIARRWGIGDLPNFSRRFRAEFGESPRDYRARHGAS